MTTPEAIYRTALEHIRDGSDAVCTACGWMGKSDSTISHKEPMFPTYVCVSCKSRNIEFGADEIAAYALAQGERGE